MTYEDDVRDDEFDEQGTAFDLAGRSTDPQLFYGSVDEFVREYLSNVYRRAVGGQSSLKWSARWWENAEAISRLDALWRAWEHLRLDPATGMSVWWRDHADHHMAALLSPNGPFATSDDHNRRGDSLPYAPPPEGLFPDMRESDS